MRFLPHSTCGRYTSKLYKGKVYRILCSLSAGTRYHLNLFYPDRSSPRSLPYAPIYHRLPRADNCNSGYRMPAHIAWKSYGLLCHPVLSTLRVVRRTLCYAAGCTMGGLYAYVDRLLLMCRCGTSTQPDSEFTLKYRL